METTGTILTKECHLACPILYEWSAYQLSDSLSIIKLAFISLLLMIHHLVVLSYRMNQ